MMMLKLLLTIAFLSTQCSSSEPDTSLPAVTQSEIKIMIMKNEVFDYVPSDALLEESAVIPGDQVFVYWVPSDPARRLFDVIDLKHELIPNLVTTQIKYYRFFTVALLAQYIIPAWRGDLKLTDREYLIFKAISPYLQLRLRFYFQHLIWAVYFQTGHLSRESSELMKNLNDFVELFGFQMKNLPLRPLNATLYGKNRGEAPITNVLMVAKHWKLDIKKILKNVSRIFTNFPCIAEGNWDEVNCLSVLATIMPKNCQITSLSDSQCDDPLTLKPLEQKETNSQSATVVKKQPSVDSDNVLQVQTRSMRKRQAQTLPNEPSPKRLCQKPAIRPLNAIIMDHLVDPDEFQFSSTHVS